ncbi:hypothetical protein [Nocardioides marmoribigeumensis]|uniref:Glycosyltransferase RgtA/B/C/D-like domain-containing protein n=1 Tax=Nocardioides marmoribigeumensis TaxID=433649 RepID=A0ABU2BRF6_9ACTN|nr:hypothetical protein [Nocardioides marmoribigeumensis]MDR7360569.1 hypothetical protein [Nocardioides marmoribigeumensis]
MTGRRANLIALGVGAGLICVWVAAVLAMLDRGFDLSDEGYYLLSYEHWRSLTRTHSGNQYVLGPIFNALHESVPALRGFRLVSVLASFSWFAWAFVRWADCRELCQLSRLGRVNVAVWVVASAGATYAWSPLSPGYNDTAIVASAVIAASILHMVSVGPGERVRLWPAVACGVAALVLILAKWTAGIVAVVWLASCVIVSLRAGRRAATRRVAFGFFAGLLTSLGALHVAVIHLGEAVPPMLEVNRMLAGENYSPLSLLGLYVQTAARQCAVGALIALPLIVVGGLQRATSKRAPRMGLAIALLGVPATLVLCFPSTAGVPGVGATGLDTLISALAALCAVAAVGTVSLRRSRRMAVRLQDFQPMRLEDSVILWALCGLPLAQAAGSNNPVLYVALAGFPFWVACLALQLARSRERALAWTLAASALGWAVTVAAVAGALGTMLAPYRTAGFAEADTSIAGEGPAEGLRVSAAEAARVHRVREALDGIDVAGRPMIVYDELAGLTWLLGGEPVGEAWFGSDNPRRSAAAVASACQNGNPWGTRQPVIIFSRTPTRQDLQGLAACDIDLRRNYLQKSVSGWSPVLRVYVPH